MKERKGLKCSSVVEATAGQGTAVGYKFEHLKKIINGVDETKSNGGVRRYMPYFCSGL